MQITTLKIITKLVCQAYRKKMKTNILKLLYRHFLFFIIFVGHLSKWIILIFINLIDYSNMHKNTFSKVHEKGILVKTDEDKEQRNTTPFQSS